MSRYAFLGGLLGLFLISAAEAQDREIIACGSDQVVLFEDTRSADGHYALGWTLRPASGGKPIDWAAWKKAPDQNAPAEIQTEAGERAYRVANFVVDLRKRTTLPFPSDYHPGKNRLNLRASWAPAGESQAGFVFYDERFSTGKIWLLRIADGKLQIEEVLARFEQEVQKALRRKQPKTFARYATLYGITTTWEGSRARVSFTSEIPKSVDAPGVEGELQVELPAGKVTAVTVTP